MDCSKNKRRKYLICISVGLQLMSLALFLHPMSPENFLSLALTDPIETIRNQYGFGMALLFWLSLAVIATGLFGWIDESPTPKSQREPAFQSLSSHTAD